MLPSLVVALCSCIMLVVHLHNNADHAPALGAWARPLELGAVAACVMMAIAIARRVRGAPHATRPLRLWFVVLALAWLTSLGHAYEQGASYYTLVLALGVVAALDAFGPSLVRRWPRASEALELVAINVAVLFVGLELVLRLVAALTHSPLLVSDASDARSWLAVNKLHPGDVLNGFRVNRRGFYDDEPRNKERCLVTAVGDSFTVGIVPHDFHFTTVAERALGCPIDAIGVIAVGPEEYALLVRDEALPRDPDVVLIDLFVGNDIVDNLRGRDHFRNALRRWLDRDNILVYDVPRRLAVLVRERRRHVIAPAAAGRGELFGRDEALRRMPWLADPSREPPSMSHEAYLTLETRHMIEVAGGGDDASYRRLWEILDDIRRAVAPRPLALLVIPDEAQVEDPLWAEVTARAARPLERDRAQRLLAATLDEKKIPYLDLLPILRAEPVTADGMRHLFHKDDSHLNARGNVIAGEALGRFLRALVPTR